jgi:Lon protease-like protein
MVEIPLFPLPMVMFPSVIVPLHIFEERYKILINRSIDEDREFGIVLNTPGSSTENESTIRRVGVSVRVTQTERLDDGRLNIEVAGERRFRILEFTGNKPYWKAMVEFLEDDESSDDLQESFNTVKRLYRAAHTLASQLRGTPAGEIVIPDSPAGLSYLVSYVLGISWDAKEDLLEMSSVAGRLKSVAIHLEELIQNLNARLDGNKIDRKLNGNGHYRKPN